MGENSPPERHLEPELGENRPPPTVTSSPTSAKTGPPTVTSSPTSPESGPPPDRHFELKVTARRGSARHFELDVAAVERRRQPGRRANALTRVRRPLPQEADPPRAPVRCALAPTAMAARPRNAAPLPPQSGRAPEARRPRPACQRWRVVEAACRVAWRSTGVGRRKSRCCWRPSSEALRRCLEFCQSE